MINDDDVSQLIKSASVGRSTAERYAFLMSAICRCLREVTETFPNVARDALNAAESYWIKNEGSVAELELARERCWSYLDEIGATRELNSPSVITVRAVICALYPAPEHEDFDEETFRWFTTLLIKLGDYSANIKQVLAGSN